MGDRYDLDDWILLVRAQIVGSTVAMMTQDQIARGAGPPTAEDIRGFSEEGFAVASLWEEDELEALQKARQG